MPSFGIDGHCCDAQVTAEKQRNATEAPDEPLDPYENSLIMPLADFVAHPMVDDVLGNGEAMQVSACLIWD